MHNLGTLGGGGNNRSFGYAISANGEAVAGRCILYPAGLVRAFRWTSAGMHDLGSLGGSGAAAHAANVDGSVIAGYSTTIEGEIHAFRWTDAGMQDLGALDGGVTHAFAISGDGSTVGGSANVGGSEHAMLWDSSIGLVDLNEHLPAIGVDLTGWELVSVSGLSLDGSAMTGWGNFDGQARAFYVSLCRADFDGDGFVSAIDLDEFVTAFDFGESSADFDRDGFIAGTDLDLYVQAFELGC